MTIDLTDTTTSAIHDALRQARLRLGGVASGMVLTLVIVTDEGAQYDAVRAASAAGRQHPCRILVVIIRRPEQRSRLDAEIRVGETSPGETVLLRMYGPLGQHADSVVAPLLLPDTPVVTWWPDIVPPIPAQDPIGALAQRRIADEDVQQQPLVGFGAAHGERLAVGEVHVHVPDLHRRAGNLGAEADRDPLVGLHPDHYRVLAQLLGVGGTEGQVRCPLEDQRDLRHPARQSLARAQVERDSGPAPGVDAQPQRGVRLRT